MKRTSGYRKNLIIATCMSIFTLVATMCATFAWFMIPKPNASLDTISGDMSITVDKLSAYRYVYPYYKDSNSYIDYSIDPTTKKDKGQLKQFVITDTTEINPLETAPTIPEDESFTKTALYLVGDHTYLGENTSTEFSLSSGLIFSSSTDALTFTIEDVTLSVGSHFTVARNDSTIVSFTGFADTDDIVYSNNHFTCRKAGLYDVRITKSSADADATYSISITKNSRDDESIFGMTLFDPTYALLNGTQNDVKGRADAIYDQNTCLIYDVEISVKNQTRDFTLSLDVKRQELQSEDGKITDTSYDLSRYVTYRYKKHETGDTVSALFSSTFHAKKDNEIYNKPDSYTENTSSNDDSTTTSDMKVLTFDNRTDTSISLFSNEGPESHDSETTKFHFYIAVDYSPVAVSHFFEESQLSKTYDLIRDYTFYFSSTQVVNEATV